MSGERRKLTLDEQQERYVHEALDVWLEADDVTTYERNVIEGVLAKLEPNRLLMAQAHGRREHVGQQTPLCLACRKFPEHSPPTPVASGAGLREALDLIREMLDDDLQDGYRIAPDIHKAGLSFLSRHGRGVSDR